MQIGKSMGMGGYAAPGQLQIPEHPPTIFTLPHPAVIWPQVHPRLPKQCMFTSRCGLFRGELSLDQSPFLELEPRHLCLFAGALLLPVAYYSQYLLAEMVDCARCKWTLHGVMSFAVYVSFTVAVIAGTCYAVINRVARRNKILQSASADDAHPG